ncbi:hypothetical protein [Variovorax sp. LG9.2]|uniref:thiolase family protein n=1 Tax=Variovorax sp. LG9.2 TaxID=3048626 RepID=UPI002B232BD1|nr:hypothetical protein [Variovorax sp. LG9.2]MEB0059785.1 hypothetical protein [Variovorax sp. LG9.2]
MTSSKPNDWRLELVITARTGIGRARKGSLNATKSPTMMGHAISHALQGANVESAEIEDVVIGCVLSAGTAGMNLARNVLLAAGLPATLVLGFAPGGPNELVARVRNAHRHIVAMKASGLRCPTDQIVSAVRRSTRPRTSAHRP